MDICSCRADYFNCLPDRGTPGIREGNNPCSQSSSIYRRLYRRGYAAKPSQIVALINNQISDTLEVNSLQMARNPEEAWMVSFKNAGRRQLSINPYSGEINGWVEGSSFFQTVRKLHRWLLDAPAQKGAPSTGKPL